MITVLYARSHLAFVTRFVTLLCLISCLGESARADLLITQSVGKGGKNKCNDVRIIQYLLNHVPNEKGGTANAPLKIDGKTGPITEAAILKFQSMNSLATDSRVDPGGRAIKKLNELNSSGDFKPGRSAKFKSDGTPASGPHPGAGIAWGNIVTAEFKAKVIQIANDLEADPSDLMAAMYFESGGSFAPDKVNESSCAIGLIQFVSLTSEGLGTSQFSLLQMDAETQLDFVKKYLMTYKGKIKSLPDLYMAILNPSFVGKSGNSAVFTKVANPLEYEQNKGLDLSPADGVITKDEAAAKVKMTRDEGLRVGNAG
ncbi:MAG: peptidoglycan-binding domain-containing protein [Isosphaeraceae bacterium]